MTRGADMTSKKRLAPDKNPTSTGNHGAAAKAFNFTRPSLSAIVDGTRSQHSQLTTDNWPYELIAVLFEPIGLFCECHKHKGILGGKGKFADNIEIDEAKKGTSVKCPSLGCNEVIKHCMKTC